jgi:quinol monooxygenase YgiN
MIFIVVKFPVRPERVEDWLDAVADFTTATRAEPGNIMFEWSRSVDVATEFVLVEAFRDGEAGATHVNSPHFSRGVSVMSDLVSDVPKIINGELPADGWSPMAEVQPSRH